MKEGTRAQLEAMSTATVTMQLLKRGIRSVFMSGVRQLVPGGKRLVGEAYTLRYVPMREDRADLAALASPDNLARRAIDECPAGKVLVVDARGLADCGTLGDILVTRLKVRGVAGVVADGGVRDLDAVRAIGLPVYASGPAAPASPAAHYPVGLDEPVSCGGVAVFPGDVIVADGDGAVVVPAGLADEVARDGAEQESMEAFIQTLVEGGRPIIGTYPPTDEVRQLYAAWKKEQGGG